MGKWCRKKKMVAIVLGFLAVVSCFAGCDFCGMSEVSASGDDEISLGMQIPEEMPAPIYVENGEVLDEEALLEFFYGESRAELQAGGYLTEEWSEDCLTSFHCNKDDIELDYVYTYTLEEGNARNFFSMSDGTERAGYRYSSMLKKIYMNDVISNRVVDKYTDRELEGCTREEAIAACASIAEYCGYQDAQAKVYAITDPYESFKMCEAYLVVYNSVFNGMVFDTTDFCLMCIYDPSYERVVYAHGDRPLTAVEMLEETELITKEEAVAEALRVLQIESLEEITILETSLVYAPENEKLNFDETPTVDPCWRIDYQLSEDLLELENLDLGFVHPTSGKILVDGKEIGKDIDMPQNVGAIIENPGFLPEYSGFKNLKFLAMIRGKIGNEEIKEAIRLVGLDPDSKKHVGKYSLGMLQRLGLAQALMENPDILLLDEPLSGLDNDGVQEMHELLMKQKKQGRLLVIASHSKEDIAVLCDEVFRFDKGKMIGHDVAERDGESHREMSVK